MANQSTPKNPRGARGSAADKKLSKENINNQLAQAMVTITELQGQIDDLQNENNKLKRDGVSMTNMGGDDSDHDKLMAELEQRQADLNNLREAYELLKSKQIAGDNVAEEMLAAANKTISDINADMKRRRNISIGVIAAVAIVSLSIAIFK